ncbi:serine hydrolase [Lacticaseibacillus sp. GG6-2]
MRHQRKSRYWMVALILVILIGGGLFYQMTKHQSDASTKPAISSSSKSHAVASTTSKSTSKKVSTTSVSRSGRAQQATAPDKVYGHALALDPSSNEGLKTVIAQTMASVAPSTHGPARWTVAVKALDGTNAHAYVSDWTPANQQFSASTIKLFILIRYYQCLASGQLHRSDTYTLRKQDVVEGSGVMLRAPLGTTYTLQQLVTLMIEKSDNIATNVLMTKVGGFDAVNRTIAGLVGPNHYSSLERKMMDTTNISNGKANRINAQEVVDTLQKLYAGKIVSKSADQEMLTMMTKTFNRTKLPANLPAGAVCYNKSGESSYRGIENDMAIIVYQGHAFAVCALTEMDGEGEAPKDAIPAQTNTQVAAIASLGANLTNWFVTND